MAFQALAVIGAQTAAAAVTCAFAGGVVTVTMGVGDSAEIQQDTTSGTIEVNGLACAPVAPIATTTAIAINGNTGDEFVLIDLYSDNTPTTISWGTVDWTINLGSGTADEVFVDDSGGDTAVKVTAGVSGIDLNTDGNLDVTHAGVEFLDLEGGPGKDTLSAAGDTTTGAAFATGVFIDGLAGNDTLSGGAGNDSGVTIGVVGINGIFGDAGDDTLAGGLGDDLLNGGAQGPDGDTADFSASTTAVTANLTTFNATGQGLDTLTSIENLTGSPQGDTLTGLTAQDNYITPGAGDDKVDGVGTTDEDTVDYSDATAAVTVDLTAGTATGGSGNDSLKNVEDVQGSDFADTLTGNDLFNGLFGGAGNDTLASMAGDDDLEGEGGVDVVDYSWSASPVTVLLSCDTAVAGDGDIGGSTNPTKDDLFTIENALLTADDDSFTGNQFANRVWPNGGQNSLDGDSGKSCTTTPGGDTLDYSVGYDTGVEVNMAGGATAGDSAVNFENAVGTKFADNITGNASSNSVAGRGGNDNLKGGGGDDELRGAKGNDVVRGGSGDDDMFGGPGKKDRGYGGSGTDLCRGFELRRGCEIR